MAWSYTNISGASVHTVQLMYLSCTMMDFRLAGTQRLGLHCLITLITVKKKKKGTGAAVYRLLHTSAHTSRRRKKEMNAASDRGEQFETNRARARTTSTGRDVYYYRTAYDDAHEKECRRSYARVIR